MDHAITRGGFRRALGIAGLGVACLAASPAAANVVSDAHTDVELVAEATTLQPGHDGWIALRLALEPGWHVYWKHPGDSGLPPSVSWSLPDGFSVGEMQWPFPERIDAPPLTSYGYEGEVLLPVPLQVQPSVAVGEHVIRATVNWLVCENVCIPGSAELELPVRVADAVPQPDPSYARQFADARSRLPIQHGSWTVLAQSAGDRLTLTLQLSSGVSYSLSAVQFFPSESLVIEQAAEQRLTKIERGYVLEMPTASVRTQPLERVRGVLVSAEGFRGPGTERALAVDVPVTSAESSAPRSAGAILSPSRASSLERVEGSSSRFPVFPFFFAFLGGIILNLMPCVFPVLSLKVLGFVRQAGEDANELMAHGWIFAAGVLASFWALAAVLMALRAGGQQIGWGFQLQSPVVVVALLSVFFLFALNLFGVFEIGTSFTRLGGLTGRVGGYSGAFFSGVLATAVATPCTAPFMGAALGFALTQSPVVGFGVFTSLGAGMAFPYVLLCRFPALLRAIPKPGPWMQTLRQLMGFLLMTTALWLLWVLDRQVGRGVLPGVLAGLLVMCVGAWILGRWTEPGRRPAVRWIARAAAVICLCVGVGLGMSTVRQGAQSQPAGPAAAHGMWEPYSEARLKELRAAGRPVFLDFTAAWCLSCQVNDRVALGQADVVAAFQRVGVTVMKADWTSYDPDITAALAAFGRNSIPLYVLYGGDPGEAPKILPELLTPGIVLDALRELEKSS